MSWRDLRKLLFGETRILPIGIACCLVLAALGDHFAGHWWHAAGGFVLLGLILTVLALAVLPARR